jgi:hypothetical protein
MGTSRTEENPIELLPNPFNASPTIRYGLPHKSDVHLTVCNSLGRQIATLVQGQEEAGYHEVRVGCSGLIR